MSKPSIKQIVRTLDVHDAAETVDSIVTATDAKNLAEATIATAREELDAKVAEVRRHASYSGVLVNTVKARGSNRSVTYTFSNSYTSTSVVAETKMKEDLGSMYETLFTRTRKAQLREGAMEVIKKLLGDKFNDLLETVDVITPKPEFRQNIHNLRQQLPLDKAKMLDDYEQAFTCRPAMKVNG